MNGRPAVGAVVEASPGLPRGFVEQFLDDFPDRYFELFSLVEVAEHALAVYALLERGETRVMVARYGESVSITVIGFNSTGIFSAITGLLSAGGLDIASGDIFTSRPHGGAQSAGALPKPGALRRKLMLGEPPGGLDARPRTRGVVDPQSRSRVIIDLFRGRLPADMDVEAFTRSFEERYRTVAGLFASGQPDDLVVARQLVYEAVVGALADKPGPSSFLLPMEISVDENATGVTRLHVVSHDTPFFLFTLSNALALHDVSIEHVTIRTANERIEDVLDLVDAHGAPITDPQRLNLIKLSVLVTKQFTYFLGAAPDPYAAMTRFESISDDILSLTSNESLRGLLDSPRILEDLAKLLGTSDFLWEDFIRGQYESILPMLDPPGKRGGFSRPIDDIEAALGEALRAGSTPDEKRAILNRFKDDEVYRIDLDHLLTPGTDFLFLSRKLTALAEAVVRAAVRLASAELSRSHGQPRTYAGLPAQYTVLGLGKLGGQALGYASDIELMFVYSDAGTTDGAKPLSNREYFELLFRDAVASIEAKREGIFHVDLRLRPYGSKGPLATSLDELIRYYGADGEARSFEKLALVRMRAVGGDEELGRRVERLRDEMIYASDAIDVSELREIRELQLREKTEHGRLNAKFSPGALVDLEYSVQIIQCGYGKDNPRLRTPSIHDALDELVAAGHISDEEAKDLVEAYHFLRRLINGLRVLRGSARDLYMPPTDSEEWVHLARRIGYTKQLGLTPAQLLHLELETRTASVRNFVERHLGRDSLPGPPVGNAADLVLSDALPLSLREKILSDGGLHDAERAYRNIRSLAGSDRRRQLFARLAVLAWDTLARTPDPDMALNNWERFAGGDGFDAAAHFERLLAQPKRLDILLAIFAGSQFLSDAIIRDPDLLDWVSEPSRLHRLRGRDAMLADLTVRSRAAADRPAWRAEIRRFRLREIVRIGTRDICLGAPMRDIVLEISNVADAVLEAAVQRAWHDAADGTAPDGAAAPAGGFTVADAGFCVLAFGKLGGRELNYSSDIDLMGVCGALPADRVARCEQVLEAVRSDLADHTQDGYAYRVDFRLRPYGRSGRLVQPLETVIDYYRNHASLWEYQALLKLRPAAGHQPTGTALLDGVRSLVLRDWNGARVRDTIAALRSQAVREASQRGSIAEGYEAVDVKNGLGGLRDIEFVVQGFQLVHGRRTPAVVTPNTLAGIDALTAGRLLDAEDGRALEESYLYLRRVEHFLQLYEDRQVHAVPSDPNAREALARRIEGRPADAAAFTKRLDSVRERVRSIYERSLASLAGTAGRTGNEDRANL